MKKPLIIMLFLLGGTVVAQQLAWQDNPVPETPGAEESQPENTSASDTEEGAVESADAEGEESGAAENEDDTGGESDIPEVDESELTTEIEDEFEPTEEISEDYPVPLPSDI